MPTIKVELNEKSIQKAIDTLNDYRESLNRKVTELVEELTRGGVKVAQVAITTFQGDSEVPQLEYSVNPHGQITQAVISITGRDVLFIEFGAGIAFNTGEQNPYADKFGYGIGTYPSKNPPNKAIQPGRWHYSRDGVTRQISYGTEATMPMYRAIEDARNNLIRTAIEKFRGK